MEYEIIQPPSTLKFRAMSREEANNYYGWFMEQIPIRIRVLERAVQSTAGYEGWIADYTPGSLGRLGQWFYEHVETRKRTKKEEEAIYNKAPKWFGNVKIEDWELTNQTFSLSMDIGMYLSQVFERNSPGLMKWTMVERPKNDINYQQPVLVGTSKRAFNPVHMLVVCAYSLADDTRGPEELMELYSIWANLLVK